MSSGRKRVLCTRGAVLLMVPTRGRRKREREMSLERLPGGRSGRRKDNGWVGRDPVGRRVQGGNLELFVNMGIQKGWKLTQGVVPCARRYCEVRISTEAPRSLRERKLRFVLPGWGVERKVTENTHSNDLCTSLLRCADGRRKGRWDGRDDHNIVSRTLERSIMTNQNDHILHKTKCKNGGETIV